ncbi:MAG: class I SAM-dependent methyltransferase [Desulfatiglandaceae bacterium]|jgi:ubiquinone/menaquinone biosynthesis C-methylase UbiE
MKLNRVERWVVNNSLRVMLQRMEMNRFRRMAALHPGATILEIGCGRGAGGRLIMEAFQPGHLHLLDLDPRMVEKAQASLSRREKSTVFCHVGDAIRLPFRSSALDALFGFGFLHHVPEWQAAVGEIARVLKPGGIYYMEELYPSLYQNWLTRRILRHPPENRFRSHDLRETITKAGMDLKEVFEFRKVGILGVAVKEGAP